MITIVSRVLGKRKRRQKTELLPLIVYQAAASQRALDQNGPAENKFSMEGH